MSAVAYYFGRRIHETLKVPVGLIGSSWGGTAAEFWVPWGDMAAEPELGFLTRAWKERKDQRILDRGQLGQPHALQLLDLIQHGAAI